MTVTLRDIVAAESVVRPHIRTTPVLEVDPRDFGCDCDHNNHIAGFLSTRRKSVS